ncbi:unnamed protein product [Oikopleura dioica]|uniref:Uncharacterized protein n=1 Tax=Oikopleura dioica TaxID=34765 RepID=E4XRW8_OIKDI|nr:unnamed protein product [Oikopleura dioica]
MIRSRIASLREGGHSDKISCFVRPTAEPSSKIFGLSDRNPSRAELSDCPKIARLGTRALFRTNSDIGQPSSQDFWNLILSGIYVFFFLNNYFSRTNVSCQIWINVKNKDEKIIPNRLNKVSILVWMLGSVLSELNRAECPNESRAVRNCPSLSDQYLGVCPTESRAETILSEPSYFVRIVRCPNAHPCCVVLDSRWKFYS